MQLEQSGGTPYWRLWQSTRGSSKQHNKQYAPCLIDHSTGSRDRFGTRLALQPWLGLCSKWRSGHSALNPPDSVPARGNLNLAAARTCEAKPLEDIAALPKSNRTPVLPA
jgi:hypothetical protein